MVLRSDDFTDSAKEILQISQEVVQRYTHTQWDVEHVFLALLEQKESVPVVLLRESGVDVEAIYSLLDKILRAGAKAS